MEAHLGRADGGRPLGSGPPWWGEKRGSAAAGGCSPELPATRSPLIHPTHGRTSRDRSSDRRSCLWAHTGISVEDDRREDACIARASVGCLSRSTTLRCCRVSERKVKTHESNLSGSRKIFGQSLWFSIAISESDSERQPERLQNQRARAERTCHKTPRSRDMSPKITP